MDCDRERKEVEEVWFALGQCALLEIGGGKHMKVEPGLEYCQVEDVAFVEWLGRWVAVAGGRWVAVVGMRDVVVGTLVIDKWWIVDFGVE